MAKFMILYNSTTLASQQMANVSPERMKASMDEWLEWRDATNTWDVA